MHVPDGLLAAEVWGAACLVAAGGVSLSVKRSSNQMGDRTIPVMGVTAAFIFAAQMFNFPVAAGTSGHLLGAMLAGLLLGPWAGSLALSLVLVIQCLLLGDGGLTALGANIFNMALAGVWSGYAVFRLIRKLFPGSRGLMTAVFAGSWISVEAAALLCGLELGLSGTYRMGPVLAAMTGVHAIIGLFEGLITAIIAGFLLRTRPVYLLSGSEGAQ